MSSPCRQHSLLVVLCSRAAWLNRVIRVSLANTMPSEPTSPTCSVNCLSSKGDNPIVERAISPFVAQLEPKAAAVGRIKWRRNLRAKSPATLQRRRGQSRPPRISGAFIAPFGENLAHNYGRGPRECTAGIPTAITSAQPRAARFASAADGKTKGGGPTSASYDENASNLGRIEEILHSAVGYFTY